MKKIVSALAALFLSASAAQAATVTYDFLGAATNVPTLTLNSGGVSLDITATGGNVARTANGIGVTGNPEGGRLGLGEFLTFDFGTTIVDQIEGLVFEAGGQAEQFGVIIDGTVTIFTLPAAGGNSTLAFDFNSLIPATGVSVFTIFGAQPDAAGNRGVKVTGLTVNAINLASVPLPAGSLLLLTGLGALALRRRR